MSHKPHWLHGFSGPSRSLILLAGDGTAGCRSPWANVLCQLDRAAGAGSLLQTRYAARHGNEVECTRLPWPGRRGVASPFLTLAGGPVR